MIRRKQGTTENRAVAIIRSLDFVLKAMNFKVLSETVRFSGLRLILRAIVDNNLSK